MKWFSLDKKCDLCQRRGPSVLNISHGDKTIRMCSFEWNSWISDILPIETDDGTPTSRDYLIDNESCEWVRVKAPDLHDDLF